MPASRIFHPDQVQWRPYVYRAADVPEFRRAKPPAERSEERAVAAASPTEVTRAELTEEMLQIRIDEAYERGRHDGEKQARESAAAEVKQALNEAARSVASLAGMRPRLRKQAEADLVHLAVEIARRVIRREINVDPDALCAIAAAALERIESQEVLRARVSPAQRQAFAAALQSIAPERKIDVCADTTVPFGGLILETSRGRLDASVESQLEEIEHGLAERMG